MEISPKVGKLPKKATKEKSALDKAEYIGLVEMFSELMSAYGSFAGSLGKIQKEHEETYKELFSIEAAMKLPELLNKIMGPEYPPELGRLVITIFAKLTAFLPKISGIMDLSADDKIMLAENLKGLAKDFKKLEEWVEKTGE